VKNEEEEPKVMKLAQVHLEDKIYDRVEVFAKDRGLEFEEALRFIIGDSIFESHIPFPQMQVSDPMKPFYNVMAGMGMCKCHKCSTTLISDEIMVNGDQCFKCKPDTRHLEF
jgi:hypothetical protein